MLFWVLLVLGIVLLFVFPIGGIILIVVALVMHFLNKKSWWYIKPGLRWKCSHWNSHKKPVRPSLTYSDEVQDISGKDFSFLEQLMEANINMLFVGDFFQHTYNTSLDGNVNKNLFDDPIKYMKRFEDNGVTPDTTTLLNSWRCSRTICDYISANLGIRMSSNRTDNTVIQIVSAPEKIERILCDESIVKLHYQNSAKYGPSHKNWGDTKGEDCYGNVCVMLNKSTMQKYNAGKLSELAPLTRNKLYVAITRSRENVYFVRE